MSTSSYREYTHTLSVVCSHLPCSHSTHRTRSYTTLHSTAYPRFNRARSCLPLRFSSPSPSCRCIRSETFNREKALGKHPFELASSQPGKPNNRINKALLPSMHPKLRSGTKLFDRTGKASLQCLAAPGSLWLTSIVACMLATASKSRCPSTPSLCTLSHTLSLSADTIN